MKHLLTFLLLVLIFTSCNSEQRLQNAIENIGNEGAFMSSGVGIAGIKPSVYINYERVLALASPDQLRQLINDERPAVRIYGFQGMVETNHPETFQAFRQLLPDTTSLMTMGGCIISSGRINSLAANLLTSEYSKSDFYQLKGHNRIVFDSLLLFSGQLPLERWTNSLETVAPVDQHYEAIKKLALDSNSMSAQLGLANFQREEDIGFFLSNFNISQPHLYSQTMEVIFRFPHPSFLKFLKSAQLELSQPTDDYYDFTDLYLALFQYPPETVKFFVEELDTFSNGPFKEEHQQSAWIAAQLTGNSSKQELVKAVVPEEYQVRNLEWLKGLAKYAQSN